MRNIVMIICMLVYSHAFSQIVSIGEASLVAENFILSRNINANKKSTTVRHVSAIGQRDAPALYVISFDDSWVLIAGDKRITPILAYSDDGAGYFPNVENRPLALNDLLDWYQEQIEYLRDSIVGRQNDNSDWVKYSTTSNLSSRSVVVSPLLSKNGVENNWGQTWNNDGNIPEKNYNKYCPIENGTRSPVGCSALAAAIIMWYWEWPNVALVQDDGGNSFLRHYNWELMPCALTSSATIEEANMVANLLHDIGVISQMHYHSGGSYTNTRKMFATITDTYRYLADTIHWRKDYSETEWFQLLKYNLDEGCPLFYEGLRPNSGGHAFVVDGYTSENEFHINYGWNGDANGYYRLDTIAGGGFYFTNSQEMITSIHPKYLFCRSLNLLSPSPWPTNFAIHNAGDITISNRAIKSNQRGTIYSSEHIKLRDNVHFSCGSTVRIAIKNIQCEDGIPAWHQRSEIFSNNMSAIENSTINNHYIVQPNPATDHIIISCAEPLAAAMIYNLNGLLVIQAPEHEINGVTNPKINVSSLPAGVYVVRAQTSSGQQLQAKFVKL